MLTGTLNPFKLVRSAASLSRDEELPSGFDDALAEAAANLQARTSQVTPGLAPQPTVDLRPQAKRPGVEPFKSASTTGDVLGSSRAAVHQGLWDTAKMLWNGKPNYSQTYDAIKQVGETAKGLGGGGWGKSWLAESAGV